MALPVLEGMVPWTARAGRSAEGAEAAGASGSPGPNRMVFLFVPNGKVMQDWTPKTEGSDFELPHVLEPLAPVKDNLLVLTGLGHVNGLALGDGPGDHARAAGSYLTGAHPFKTGGKNIRLGVSVDQVAAREVGGATRLASLELGCDKGRNAGVCDSGYSCVYSNNISWRTEYMPMAKETNPRRVFERLFSSGPEDGDDEGAVRRRRYRKSVLDLVSQDANQLRKRVGGNDQRKIDEYFSAVRDIELRIERLNRADGEGDDWPEPDMEKPAGVPKKYVDHVRIMYDLLAVALQTDVTRIATFMLGNAGNNRPYKFLDVREGHHSLSHHGNDKKKIAALRKINRFHVTELARFLETLGSMREGDGSVLDNAMIAYGSGLGDGNRHEHVGLPMLLAGGGAGSLQPGRHVRYPSRTPMANLFLALLERMGVACDEIGDSTRPVPHLSV